MTKFITAAVLAFVSLTAAGAAMAAPAEPGRSTIVRYADLDLTTADGRAELQRRMNHAITVVCPRGTDNDLREHMNRADCRDYALASAERGTQEAMLHRYSGVEVAVAGPSGR